ncbi:hypothetical protein MASR2M15_13330 [Anaerolineales bacterium]
MPVRVFKLILLLILCMSHLMLIVGQEASPMMTIESGEILTEAVWSPAETLIASGDIRGDVKVWAADSGEALFQYHHEDSIIKLVWLDESRLLSVSMDGAILIFEDEEIRPVRPAGEDLLFFAMDAAASHYALITKDLEFEYWQVEGSESDWTATLEGVPGGISWAADGRRLNVWFNNGQIQVYDLSGEVLSYQIDVADPVKFMSWSEDQQWLLVGFGARAQVYSLEKGPEPVGKAVVHDSFIINGRFSKAAERFISWGGDDTVMLSDTASGDVLERFRLEDWIIDAQFNQAEDQVMAASHIQIGVWPIDSTVMQSSFEHEATVSGFQINADDSRLLSWDWRGSLKVWDLSGTPDGE